MSDKILCGAVHTWARALPRHHFPFVEADLPKNGIYFLFEKGETSHRGERIVRVGTHTGANQLVSRLKQHFVVENKDRSIFRKNIGRALLNKVSDPYLIDWEIDLTSRAARLKYPELMRNPSRQTVESNVSGYIRKHFTFAVISVPDKKDRLYLESRLISTLSGCEACLPSRKWLGTYSPKSKIKESGLWLMNELYKEPLSRKDFTYLRALAGS